MNVTDKARRFAELHVQGSPLLLCNAWDAGSARAIREAGAQAIASSSWAIAAAHGYADGERMPLDLHVQIAGRIAAAIDLPVTIDFEGGYSEEDGELAGNVGRLMDFGVVGINFEDRVVAGSGLHDVRRQSERIAAIRAEARRRGLEFFINARTDLFFQPELNHAEALADALERAQAYADAGASGYFVPGLQDTAVIAKLCERCPLPVNVMVMGEAPAIGDLAKLGVRRISLGPQPYLSAMQKLTDAARVALAGG